MVQKILILLLMGTTSLTVSAKEKEQKYKEVTDAKSEIINVSADDLWQIIGPGFANVGEWARAVDHAEGQGEAQFEGATCSNRYCEVSAKGFDKISEELTHYDQNDRSLAYAVYEGLPGFVLFAENFWKITPINDNQSKIEMKLTMRMKPFMGTLMGGMFRKNLDKTLVGYLEDLKIYAETGEISQAKKDRVAKLEKKMS